MTITPEQGAGTTATDSVATKPLTPDELALISSLEMPALDRAQALQEKVLFRVGDDLGSKRPIDLIEASVKKMKDTHTSKKPLLEALAVLEQPVTDASQLEAFGEAFELVLIEFPKSKAGQGTPQATTIKEVKAHRFDILQTHALRCQLQILQKNVLLSADNATKDNLRHAENTIGNMVDAGAAKPDLSEATPLGYIAAAIALLPEGESKMAMTEAVERLAQPVPDTATRADLKEYCKAFEMVFQKAAWDTELGDKASRLVKTIRYVKIAMGGPMDAFIHLVNDQAPLTADRLKAMKLFDVIQAWQRDDTENAGKYASFRIFEATKKAKEGEAPVRLTGPTPTQSHFTLLASPSGKDKKVPAGALADLFHKRKAMTSNGTVQVTLTLPLKDGSMDAPEAFATVEMPIPAIAVLEELGTKVDGQLANTDAAIREALGWGKGKPMPKYIATEVDAFLGKATNTPRIESAEQRGEAGYRTTLQQQVVDEFHLRTLNGMNSGDAIADMPMNLVLRAVLAVASRPGDFSLPPADDHKVPDGYAKKLQELLTPRVLATYDMADAIQTLAVAAQKPVVPVSMPLAKFVAANVILQSAPAEALPGLEAIVRDQLMTAMPKATAVPAASTAKRKAAATPDTNQAGIDEPEEGPAKGNHRYTVSMALNDAVQTATGHDTPYFINLPDDGSKLLALDGLVEARAPKGPKHQPAALNGVAGAAEGEVPGEPATGKGGRRKTEKPVTARAG